jgi:hypothetical protein
MLTKSGEAFEGKSQAVSKTLGDVDRMKCCELRRIPPKGRLASAIVECKVR